MSDRKQVRAVRDSSDSCVKRILKIGSIHGLSKASGLGRKEGIKVPLVIME